jgi:hypothetical protein
MNRSDSASACPLRRSRRSSTKMGRATRLGKGGGRSMGYLRRPAPAVWGNGSVGFCGMEPGDL